MIGINPGPFTLRELMFMSDGKNKSEWSRTALLSALIANPNRDTKKHPKGFSPDEFNPYVIKKKEVVRGMKPSEAFKMLFK